MRERERERERERPKWRRKSEQAKAEIRKLIFGRDQQARHTNCVNQSRVQVSSNAISVQSIQADQFIEKLSKIGIIVTAVQTLHLPQIDLCLEWTHETAGHTNTVLHESALRATQVARLTMALPARGPWCLKWVNWEGNRLIGWFCTVTKLADRIESNVCGRNENDSKRNVWCVWL